ncbi:hypothetical protein EV361DRAFT_252255 [Lentinula raphanica]|nr:hypothetical protein EV361DRAFT_252255 [Lentinula raphanica]
MNSSKDSHSCTSTSYIDCFGNTSRTYTRLVWILTSVTILPFMEHGEAFARFDPTLVQANIHSFGMGSTPVQRSYERIPTEWIRKEEAFNSRPQRSFLVTRESKRSSERSDSKKAEKEAKRRSLQQKRDSVQEWLKSVHATQDPSLLGPVVRSSSPDRAAVPADGQKERGERKERPKGARTKEKVSTDSTTNISRSNSYSSGLDNSSVPTLLSQTPKSSNDTLPRSPPTRTHKDDFLSAVASSIRHVDDYSESDTNTHTLGVAQSGRVRAIAHQSITSMHDSDVTLYRHRGSSPDGPDDDSLKEEVEIQSRSEEVTVMDSAIPSQHQESQKNAQFLPPTSQTEGLGVTGVIGTESASLIRLSPTPLENSGLSWKAEDEEKPIQRSLADEMRFAEQKQAEDEHKAGGDVIIIAQDSDKPADEDEDDDIDLVNIEEDTDEEAFEVVDVDEGGSVVTEEFQQTGYHGEGEGAGSVSSSVCIV